MGTSFILAKSTIEMKTILADRIKPIYFCFGDFRTGKKEYRIFKVRNVQDAYNVADELGLEIILDNTMKDNLIANLTERAIVSILNTIELYFHKIENVVSCYRAEYDEAQRMKQHFMNTDMAEYFPKLLETPVEETLPNGDTVYCERRTFPWVVDYWVHRLKNSPPDVMRIQTISPDDAIIYAAAVREKKQP